MQVLSANYSIAIEAAIDASKEIMRVYASSFDKEFKQDGSPVTEADLASSKVISGHLSKTNIPIICEEGEIEHYENRKSWDQFWLVDPLDGTKEFIKRNGEFAINIALVVKNKPVFGIVCSPVEELILMGGESIGVYLLSFENFMHRENWQKIEPSTINAPLCIAASRSHSSPKDKAFFQVIQQKFGSTKFIEKGSALKFIDLALGKADVYPRFAPTMEWDTASGHAIMEALKGAVLHAETMKPLDYNKEDLYNPHFIVKTNAFLLADV